MAQPVPGPVYGAVMDGDIISRSAVEQLREGDFVNVPYLLGSTNNENNCAVSQGINSEKKLYDTMFSEAIGLNVTQATEIIVQYLYSEPDLASTVVPNAELNTTIALLYNRAATIATELVIKTPTRYGAHLLQKPGSSIIYLYNAKTPHSVGPQYFGAAHGFDTAHTFYNLDGTGWEGGEPPFFAGNPFTGGRSRFSIFPL